MRRYLTNMMAGLLILFTAFLSFVEGQSTFTTSGSSSSTSAAAVPTASLAPNVNSSTYDLSLHFCRLWRHASVLADGKIYIDGGNVYVPKDGRTFTNTTAGGWTKGMHNHLLVLDLSQDFTNQDAEPFRTVLKGPGVPMALIENALWYSRATRKVYQLGGWFSFNNAADPGFTKTDAIPSAAIWEFDTSSERWSIVADGEFAQKNTGPKVERPGAAANCDVPSLNMSFIFQGFVQQRSDGAYANYTQSADFKFLGGMLSLDTSTSVKQPTLTNISVPLSLDGGKTDFGPRMNGAMVHVPIGSKGVLVQIGGQTTNEATPYGLRIPGANGKSRNIGMGFVDLYDIETGFWFRQRTFGVPNMPSGRSDICAVMVAAPDNSSFNIYMIGGVENYNTVTATEEIWVLTLPTFRWVLVHSREGGLYGHTCHAVGENLLIIGGMQAKPEGGDVQNCSTHMPAEIFSLATHNYTGLYNSLGSLRQPPVPDQVVSAIGGSPSGGATATAPAVWDDLYLQYIFNPAYARPSYTPTYTLVAGYAASTSTLAPPGATDTSVSNQTLDGGDGGNNNRNAVIGGAVGGVIGFCVLLSIIAGFCIIRRRRAAERAVVEAAGAAETRFQSELPAYTEGKLWPYSATAAPHPHPIHAPPYPPNSNDDIVNSGGLRSGAVQTVPQTSPAEMPVPGIAPSEVLGSSPDDSHQILNPRHLSVSSGTLGTLSPRSFEHPTMDGTIVKDNNAQQQQYGSGNTAVDKGSPTSPTSPTRTKIRVVSGLSPESANFARFPGGSGVAGIYTDSPVLGVSTTTPTNQTPTEAYADQIRRHPSTRASPGPSPMLYL